MRFWIDLETTGLEPKEDCILEIAVLITDDQLNVVLEGPSLVVNPVGPSDILETMDPFVLAMHTKNGLLNDIALGKGVRRHAAEQAVILFAQEFLTPEQLKKTPLAGSTVHFDRAFIKEHMPRLEALFSHRDYDVSTLKMHFEAFEGLKAPAPAEPAHRAMADIKESLEAARFFRNHQYPYREVA